MFILIPRNPDSSPVLKEHAIDGISSIEPVKQFSNMNVLNFPDFNSNNYSFSDLQSANSIEIDFFDLHS